MIFNYVPLPFGTQSHWQLQISEMMLAGFTEFSNLIAYHTLLSSVATIQVLISKSQPTDSFTYTRYLHLVKCHTFNSSCPWLVAVMHVTITPPQINALHSFCVHKPIATSPANRFIQIYKNAMSSSDTINNAFINVSSHSTLLKSLNVNPKPRNINYSTYCKSYCIC